MGLSNCQVNIAAFINNSLHASLCIGMNPFFHVSMFLFRQKRGKDNVYNLRYISIFSIMYFLPFYKWNTIEETNVSDYVKISA